MHASARRLLLICDNRKLFLANFVRYLIEVNHLRLFNDERQQPLKDVTLYLTKSEASELRDSIEGLLSRPPDDHTHVPSDDFSREITVCIYDLDSLDHFDERAKQLILED